MPARLFILMQYLLPHHLLSRLAGCLANCTWPWVKNPFISWFVGRYEVDMSQALQTALSASWARLNTAAFSKLRDTASA